MFKKVISSLLVAAVVCTSGSAFAAVRKVTVTGSTSWKGAGYLYTTLNNYNSTSASYSIQVTKSFTNTLSTSVTVSAQVVNTAVGFNTSATYTVSETLNVTAQPKYCTKVWIAPTGTQKNFEIYDDYSTYCKTVGSGSAVNVQGKVYTINGYAL